MLTQEARRLADQLEHRLAELGTPARAAKEREYLKSELRHLGVTVPAVRKAARQLLAEHPEIDRTDLLDLVKALWSAPVHERRAAAVELLDVRSQSLLPQDLPLLERLIRESRTWALVDGLAASVIGNVRERYPQEFEPTLEAWSQDPDMWLRRASMLAYLVALRSGHGDFDAFARKADRMLEERESFIRKAIGWILRDTARRRPDLVVHWLEPRLDRAAGLTVREAVKYLPEADRRRLLSQL